MFNLGLIPIVAMVFAFLLFVSYYMLNLYDNYYLMQKQDVAISKVNSFYFTHIKNGKINVSINCSAEGIFPITYDNSVCMVSANV